MTAADLNYRVQTAIRLALESRGVDDIAMLMGMPVAWVRPTLDDVVKQQPRLLRKLANGLYAAPLADHNGLAPGDEAK